MADTHILTAEEAANVLRTSTTDPNMTALLPLVDAYLKNATGHDWASDEDIRDEAKAAARMLLVTWYENPGMMSGVQNLRFGITAVITQLEAIAASYREFQGNNGGGVIAVDGIKVGDSIDSVIGIIGVSGDQSSKFESVVTYDGLIQQLSAEDLSDNWYRAYILSPGEL